MTIVAIDGPAGSGKSTVARTLAARLDLPYLDTGAMYRGVAFAAIRRGVDPVDDDGVEKVAETVDLRLDQGVVVDGVDASIEIRGLEVTRAVSTVAANAGVRRELVRRQREWVAARGGAVVEGRDIGTVVFPDAALKVYLTARLDVRATRRHDEVADLSYEEVEADLARRDSVDTERDIDPLAVADDAVVLDTSDLSVDEVCAEIERLLAARTEPAGD